MCSLVKTMKSVSNPHIKFFSTKIQELAVQAFCNIHINVPYNVRIKPLDVHKYKNSDLVRIEVDGVETRLNSPALKHIQDGNRIKIFCGNEAYDSSATCHIEAPVKANLRIEAIGDITTGHFGGSKLVLSSSRGNIFADKYEGELLDLTTDVGDIVLKKTVIAANIKALAKTGSIKTKRIQALTAELEANNGTIAVDSSYCDSCTVKGSAANVILQNMHKNCQIVISDGNLILSGLDGQLQAQLTNTPADIQISRILEDSSITLSGGDLKLKVSEECQNDTMFEIQAREYGVNPTVQLMPSKNKEFLYLMPRNESYRRVFVKCESGRVDIDSASWFNSLKLDLEK